ncbi:hypothetical protein [Breznakia pachnodae]|uniref:Apolipoprotein N-acyltransferase n=1 Tax=Breznakia pachnodae TaxID=265178 RepID=A0ABU0E3R1_9FIRM|nr:hypothetical protein [Breznakia pachnodae]MDQ0361466.1 apolipoprotein N-acyltransferase [Breznakia pachnodae]
MAKKKNEKCPNCGKIINSEDRKCINCDSSIGMKWYKFIIWFQLIVLCIYFTWLGVSFLRGTIYGGTNGIAASVAFYKSYPLLKIIDNIQGGILILLAIVSLVVRDWLVKRKKNGPKRYLILLVVVAIEPILYSYAVAIATQANLEGYTISTMYMSIIFFFVSLIYFKNRAKYFNQ